MILYKDRQPLKIMVEGWGLRLRNSGLEGQARWGGSWRVTIIRQRQRIVHYTAHFQNGKYQFTLMLIHVIGYVYT